MEKWYRSTQLPQTPLGEQGRVTMSDAHVAISLEAATEGMVLLKNNGALPLKKGTPIAMLGKGSYDYIKGGGGSGDVHTAYERNVPDGIELLAPGSTYQPLNDFYRGYVKQQRENGVVPGMLNEPELPANLLAEAAKFARVAVVSISRYSLESADRPCGVPTGEHDPWADNAERADKGVFLHGDFDLTDAEKALVEAACRAFPTVIVLLNVGGVVDAKWIRDDERISACLLTWQAGMEGGLAAAKLLFGEESPCGKLTDTFPMSIADIPSTSTFHENRNYVHYTEDIYVGYRYFETIPGMRERVCYPFSYGLSYTEFAVDFLGAEQYGHALTFRAAVTNTGSMAGKEVVQLYVCPPQGKLGKPMRSLIAFAKTGKLAPGETQQITLQCSLKDAASFDDTGVIRLSAKVLEQGEYAFFLGTDVRSAQPVHTITLDADEVVEQLHSYLAPTLLPQRLKADGTYEAVPAAPKRHAAEKEEHPVHPAPEKPVMLIDVAEGRADMADFLAQLTDEQLIHLCGGQPCTGVADTCGMGNLPEYGVPNIMTADGPAGVRITPAKGVKTTAFPCETLLACTWNPELVERVGAAGGAELKENNLVMWLAPAVNIHRNPLCGRNFEYYSEDPLVSGVIGGAMVKGIQSVGVSACVKHFACNNKEHERADSDSRVSERALREIYFPAFERIVKDAHPLAIMTSYNLINGCHAAENYDMITGVLRGEWGYKGLVITDWWGNSTHYLEVLAGSGVKMPGGHVDALRDALAKGLITRYHLEQCAVQLLRFLCKVD